VGLTACLISPISWVHHLYWIVPAVAVLLDVAAGTPVETRLARRRPRAVRATAAAAALAVTGTFAVSLIWFFVDAPADPWTTIGENAYVLVMLVLVTALPARNSRTATGVAFSKAPGSPGHLRAGDGPACIEVNGHPLTEGFHAAGA
jgi:alpha-1,2-mannosyltransferase